MRTRTSSLAVAFVVAMAIAPCFSVLAGDAPEVTIRNYVRAETDLQMRTYIEKMDEDYLQKFPYQETYRYAMLQTWGDPARLNTWVNSPRGLSRAGSRGLAPVKN